MKKSKKPKKKKDELVTVKSNTYGEHQRAKRGTYTEAVLNDKMKMSSKKQGESNKDASLVRKELLPFFYETKPRLFWPRLLSVTRAAYKGGPCLDPTKFINFEVYEEYKFGRLASPDWNINVEGYIITVEVEWSQSPTFNRKFPDGYIYGVLCVFIDSTNLRSSSSVKYSEIYPLEISKGFLHPTQKNTLSTGAPSSGFLCIWASRIQNQNKEEIDELVISDITSA
jgi:hypothetical protein